MKMDIKGAIFDMDGTLVDSLGAWEVIYREFGERYLADSTFEPDPQIVKEVATSTLATAMDVVHERCGIGESGAELLEFANEILEKYYRETVPMKAGTLEFLEHCKKKGVKMCIASATARPLINIVIEKYGLDRYIDRVFSCVEVGKGKEHPDVFIAAHEFMGTPKESTWVFEDSLTALRTATAAGYKTVGVYDKYNYYKETAEVATEYIAEGESIAKLIEKI